MMSAKKTPANKMLNASVAKKALADLKNGAFITFHEYGSIDTDAASILAQYTGELYLDGIQKLSAEAARALAGHVGEQLLSLDGLEQIDLAVANELAKHKGPLSLGGLKSLSEDVAVALASCKYDLSLDGLELLSEGTGLFAHKAGLSLRNLAGISDDIAENLAKKEGSLILSFDFFDSIKQLSVPMAKLLVKMQAGNEIVLENLTTLSNDAAKELARHDDVLRLGLTKLSAELKEILGGVQLELSDEESRGHNTQHSSSRDEVPTDRPCGCGWCQANEGDFAIEEEKSNDSDDEDLTEEDLMGFLDEISDEESDEVSDGSGLHVDIAARGKEVYAIVIDGTKFNRNQFFINHTENYMNLSEDVIYSEIPIKGASFYVKVDGKDLISFDDKEMLGKGVDKISENKKESYRDLCKKISTFKEDDIVVMWYHDYVNGRSYTWRGIKDFNPELLEVVTYTRVDVDGDQYELIADIRYNKQEADTVRDEEGTPKSGYSGPWILEPSKAE